MNIIIRAAHLAKRAHAGQTRKWNGLPYILHPARVAARVMLLPDATEVMVAAAWLHDTIEDCGLTVQSIERELSGAVASIVWDLTNTSKHEFPNANRTKRKRMDRERLARVGATVQNIKLIDRMDNLSELAGAPEDFRKLYLEESRLLLGALTKADAGLCTELAAMIKSLDD